VSELRLASGLVPDRWGSGSEAMTYLRRLVRSRRRTVPAVLGNSRRRGRGKALHGRARMGHGPSTDHTSPGNTRLLGHPSVLPDRKTHHHVALDQPLGQLLLRRAHCRKHSPRTSACRLSTSSIPTRSLACQLAAGVFCWRGPVACRRNIHNGIPPKKRKSKGRDYQGKETRHV
jgi:hypothetical protein